MTLREYFTTHPAFRSNGELNVISDEVVTFCGVPFNAELWRRLKENRLDEELPSDVMPDQIELSG